MKNGLKQKVLGFLSLAKGILSDYYKDYIRYTNLHYFTLLFLVAVQKIDLLTMSFYLLFAIKMIVHRKKQQRIIMENAKFNNIIGACKDNCKLKEEILRRYKDV